MPFTVGINNVHASSFDTVIIIADRVIIGAKQYIFPKGPWPIIISGVWAIFQLSESWMYHMTNLSDVVFYETGCSKTRHSYAGAYTVKHNPEGFDFGVFQ